MLELEFRGSGSCASMGAGKGTGRHTDTSHLAICCKAFLISRDK